MFHLHLAGRGRIGPEIRRAEYMFELFDLLLLAVYIKDTPVGRRGVPAKPEVFV